MKITTNDAIYISKTDLLYLMNIKYPLPKQIKNKMYKNIVLNEDTTSDFVKFEKEEIDIFKDMDWILEYEAVINMSLDDINRISNEVSEEQISLSKEKTTNKIDRFDLLNIKIKALRDALLFKQGSLKPTLPKEVRIFFPERKKSLIKKILEKIS